MLKFAKSHHWTKYQDAYLLEQKDNLTIEEIARQLGLSEGQIRYRLKKLGIPTILVLNLWDLSQKRNQKINLEKFSQLIGVPIITTDALRGVGISELIEKILY